MNNLFWDAAVDRKLSAAIAMLFNSFSFVVFFIIVTGLYFALPHRFRWMLLLAASCVFYMFFIPIYILILVVTITVDYFAGRLIERAAAPRQRRRYLWMSVCSVCAVLFLFKYFNFFSQNVAWLAEVLHWNYPLRTLQLVLPIGLSFHTFQGLSYVIEVYRGRQPAERHFGLYALYVMYFPQLVAGPIERPQNLLPQFRARHRFEWERFRDGLTLSLWGLFKKVAVADSLAVYTNTIYNNSAHHNGTSLLVATYFFAIQIYCDFSGYSDIARGVSKIYGIDLMKNFETPYFSRSISEFWSRWHISLSTWFRDYLYIPLGGNRVPVPRHFFNLLVVFLVSGLWHGANWTFLVWGALHGAYMIAGRSLGLLTARLKSAAAQRADVAAGRLTTVFSPLAAWARPWGRRLNTRLAPAWKLALTFHLVLISWVFFRAESVAVAFGTLRKIAWGRGPLFWDPVLVQGGLGIAALLALDLFYRRTGFWEAPQRCASLLRLGHGLVLLFGVVLFGVDTGTQFIYFQF